ncbi:MAG TPA: HAMP domain-containing sensor histidine kinase [Thermoanaerobaculia bacterium]|nr:HAMP domain-containing sensor histidine kinase [Thermoanaerobaculia bacterium]
MSRDSRFEVPAQPRDRQAEAIISLEKGIRSRDEVLAIVAHDLRNPLTIIKSSAALLQLTTDEVQRKELIEMISTSCGRMQSLVGDLLDVARIESGGFTVDRTDVDAADVIEEMRRMFEPAAAEKGIRFEADASGVLPPLYADRNRLIQILANLVSNALRVTDRGSVRLTVDGDRDKARFSVTDTGPGIPAAELPHLFDRFWQVRSSRRGGAGLGLAIVKGFVEAHQGTIEVTSEVGKGSQFRFVIPSFKDKCSHSMRLPV